MLLLCYRCSGYHMTRSTDAICAKCRAHERRKQRRVVRAAQKGAGE